MIGHVHPAIESEGDRWPCFLHGEAVHRDADVRVGALDSPLVADAGRLSPIVSDPEAGEPLRFPPLGQFRRLL